MREDLHVGTATSFGDIASSLLLVVSVWCVVVAGRIAEEAMHDASWMAASFVLAAALVLRGQPIRWAVRTPASPTLGFVSGFASYPAWLALVWLVGSRLGLPATDSVQGPAPPSLWAASILFAPVFEEALYRENVLSVARRHAGAIAAVLLSSVLFSVSHVHGWSMLNTFLSGLLLGVVRLVSGSLPLCIALHAGFNLATLVCGLPPGRLSLTTFWSAAVGTGMLLVAVGRARPARGAP